MLNAAGYGKPGSGLKMDLVYNPGGPFLAPAQDVLTPVYKKELDEAYSITFDSLLCLNNMPIKRYMDYLAKQEGGVDAYMKLLVDSFNAKTSDSLMCRETVSVAWDGKLCVPSSVPRSLPNYTVLAFVSLRVFFSFLLFPTGAAKQGTGCVILGCDRAGTSDAVFAEISLRSPRNLFIFSVNFIFRIKVSKFVIIEFWKHFTGGDASRQWVDSTLSLPRSNL